MKLNHNCVRDILLFVEEHVDLQHEIQASLIELNNYSQDEIVYAVSKLDEAGYLKCIDVSDFSNTDFFIRSITWNGHEFLDNIRDEDTFNNAIKTVGNKVGSASLSIIAKLAESYILNLIM